MDYREYPPPPALVGRVRCFWTLEAEAPPRGTPPERVLPDGCPELVFHGGDRYRWIGPDGKVERQPTSILAGQLRRFIWLEPEGRSAVVAARLEPGAVPAILREPTDRIADTGIDFESVGAPAEVRELRERIFERPTPAGRVAILAEALTRLFGRAAPVDDVVRRAVGRVEDSGGMLPIDDLADGCGLSNRSLERRFRTSVGLSPKLFARIVRFRSAVRIAEAQYGTASLASIACAAGYFDQSHFNRDFRAFAGVSPSTYLGDPTPLSAHLLDLSAAQGAV